MKPIVLYEENENTFTSNGLGTLDEAISAEITEELNGAYEMTFTYPVTGLKFSEIKHSRIVKAVASPGGDYQLFRIYGISKAINGIITVNAEHISYQLSYIVVNPFTATSAVDAMAKLSVNATSDCPFEFWTDKQTVANYKQETPDNIRARLAGVSGSILDVYGGEYEFDNYTVKLHNHRGQNRNVTLRYGKNITDIEQEENIASTYTSIVGFWKGEDEVVKTAVIDSQYASAYPFKRVKVVDFSQEYETAPTVAQLTARATSYMNSNNFGIPNVSIKVSFVALWQTEEYKDIAVLERVYLGDTVSVYYEKLGITASAKVVRMRYNVLLDRYDSIELGKLRSNLSNKLAKQDIEIKEQITDARSALERAVEHATELIRGGLGGHVVLNTDADGKPQEILVMDTDDIHTATKVWRWNLGGLGYSKTGYDGNYGTAITMDGAIVADFITAGTMQANRVRAGLLQDETGTNYWNLTTGELRISSNTKIGSGNDTFQSVIDGIQDQIDGNITSWFYNYEPTLSNAPASTWTTVNDRIAHVGDLFYNSVTGYCYRWQVNPNAADPAHPTLNDFEWIRISDEDISEAMRIANEAQDTADGKRRVFVSTPVPPYDVGDLWSQGATGDLLRCATPRTSAESYHASDWVKASKYTDDSALTSFINNTYGPDKTNIEGQIDKKAETWYQSTDPSSVWTTTEDKAKHVGDLWYKTTDDTTWFYDYTNGVYSWKQQNVPTEVFDKIDGKAQTFVSQPVPPYSVGDIWFVGSTGDILTCVTDRAEGQSFVRADWQKKNKYTDDTAAGNVRNDLNLRINGVVGEFNLKISGIFANYTGDATPTNSNYPASSWDATDRPLHVGEVYFKTPQTEQDTGVYYRYNLTNGVYGWGVIDTTNGGYSVVTSEFKQTKNEIDLKVNKGDVVSEINLSSDTIQLNTAGRLLITAGNFKLDNTGHVTASGATLTGGSLTIDNPNYGKSIIDINYPDADVQYLLDIGAGGMEWNAKYSSLSKNGELTVESATIKDATITQANLSGCSITDGIFEVGDEVTIIGDPFYFKIDSDNKTIEWNMPNSSMSADGSLYIENGNVACKITSGTSSGSKIEIENGSITGYYNNNYCANIGLSLSNNLYQLKLKGRDQIVLEENSGTIAYFNTVASSIKSDRLDVDGMIVSDDSIIAKNFQVVQSGASSSTPGLTGVIPFRMPNGGTGYITVYGGIIINAPTQ